MNINLFNQKEKVLLNEMLLHPTEKIIKTLEKK